ncbi:MAG: DUF4878 domain-containing protein, partial [Candidatus Cloacimonetes bacterium]|nr:DUF4878 domain-containing protein [Candidatus Cloacimonadota bacterium]
MRKILFALLIIATLVSVSACGKKNTPESVADSFLTALEQKDFDTAKAIATPESEGMLSIIQSFMQSMKEEDMGVYSHKILNTVVEGDTARVSYEVWTSEKPDEKDQQEL